MQGARELLHANVEGELRRTGDYGVGLCTVTGLDGCDEASTIALMEREATHFIVVAAKYKAYPSSRA